MEVPRLIIAGTGSGVGKTTIAIALTRALAGRGLKVQPFKVGPDFLDPTYLSIAAETPCYNLDGWMSGKDYALRLFAGKGRAADITVVEGVMGLFDGASATRSDGSTAEMAQWLKAPVLLVMNAHGLGRSAAAVVKGFSEYEQGVQTAGVVANRVGSPGHGRLIADALRDSGMPPLVGAIPSGAFPPLSSRHLGLVTADRTILSEEIVEALADALERHLSVDRLIEIARSAPPLVPPLDRETRRDAVLKLGIARDEAFHFYYADALESFARAGLDLIPFSPLRDPSLPRGLHGLYIGGGYPEEHAEELARNRSMRESIRDFAASGRPVYGECGGLMYLSREIQALGGVVHKMCGVLPCGTKMLKRRCFLGYVEVELTAGSLWGEKGGVARGHEFHYSELIGDPARDGGWKRVYRMRRPTSGSVAAEGFQKGKVLASYAHLHFASKPDMAEAFFRNCEESERGRGR